MNHRLISGTGGELSHRASQDLTSLLVGRLHQIASTCALVAILALLSGCTLGSSNSNNSGSGGSGGSGGGGGTTAISVSVAAVPPNSGVVSASSTASYMATVTGDSTNSGVTWSLGSSAGSLSNQAAFTVTYDAPGTVPSPNSITLTATSVADTSQSGSATFTIGASDISVTISGGFSSVVVEAPSIPLTANVNNDDSGSGVTWTLTAGGTACSPSCGTLTPAPVPSFGASYTPPLNLAASPDNAPKITATSVTDSTKSANFSFTIVAGINFVQVNSSEPQTPQTTVSAPYPLAQNAGDLNVVAVGWPNSTSSVTSVTDTTGNTYALASAPMIVSSFGTEALFYAKNIAASDGNTVTVAFNAATPFVDLRILEYSGVDPVYPIDVTASAQGNSATSDSGPATTNLGNELIFGANFVQTGTAAAGTGFTTRIITVPDSDIAEDEIEPTTGTYDATAALTSSCQWIMQLAAFRPAGSGAVPPVQVSISPTSANIGELSQQQFSATVLNSSNTAVTWTLSGVGCSGATCGTLVNGPTANPVSYEAPVALPTPPTVTLTAMSSADTSKSASATITILAAPPISVAISTLTPTVLVNAFQPFSASVANDPNSAGVTWALSGSGCTGAACGTLLSTTTASTTYKAPGAVPTPPAVTLKATSITDPTKSASATITVSETLSAIQFVQVNSNEPQTPVVSVSAPYLAPQNAGDLNIVVVGWANTDTNVLSVADTSGNSYTLAVGPTVQSGGGSQAIYYAKNIAAAAGTNTVTVAFTAEAPFVDLRILEYSDIDPLYPLDATAAAGGNSAASTSGPATTNFPNELIFGANYAQGATSAPGSGFTSRIITAPDGNIAEDDIVSAVGTYNASATLTSSTNWVMQMATFRAAGSPPPIITVSIAPGTASVGTSLPQQFFASLSNTTNTNVNWTLSGTGCSGSSCGTLSSATANPVTYTGPTSIPSPAMVTLTATSVANNTSFATAAITVVTPAVAVSLAPRGTSITETQTQAYTATVTGTLSTAVTWYVDGAQNGNSTVGTLAVSGDTAIYSPPAATGQHTITVTSVADVTMSASALIAVTDFAGTLTYHNDVARTGQNTHEFALTTTTVNSATFGLLFSCPVDGYVYAQPLYVPNVTIPGKGVHNVLYIATEHDSVFAFDADSPSCQQLWFTSLLLNGGSAIPPADTGDLDDIYPEIGITGTPAIDTLAGTLFVVAATKESGSYVQRLHALSITTGSEQPHSPVVISASVAGTGDASSGGFIAFDPLRHLQRPALLLANGYVYVAFGSHADLDPYHGWLMAYNETSLAQGSVWCSTPNGSRGAYWNTGDGPAVDPQGSIYEMTANGTFDANTGGGDYGDSILRFTATSGVLTLQDSFTPYNQAELSSADLDLGSGGVVVLPDLTGSNPHLLIGGGKDGVLYLVDRDDLGGYAGSDHVVQEITATTNVGVYNLGMFDTLAYWNANIYVAPVQASLEAFSQNTSSGAFSTDPTSASNEVYNGRGTNPVVSASGTTNGLVWALDISAFKTSGAAILRAYDATNLATTLYDSSLVPNNRDQGGPAVKFSLPTVANGKVYIGNQGAITVYGLLP
ncbi:MAG: hypothetical protein WA755_07745 [Candidatus Acidiferrales bacterium]